jgi:hypothetical protein
MMIATVDKFAMMAWRGRCGRCSVEREPGMRAPRPALARARLLYRQSSGWAKACLRVQGQEPVAPIRPPDLIIQDEFHLISGPLGTMVGLYEIRRR